MNNEFWQLRAASRNYLDAHRTVTRLSNRIKALARDGHTEPLLNNQLAIAQESRKKIGADLTRLYEQLAPIAIIDFQKATPGLGELYMAQLIGVVGDFKTYTEAWWEENTQPTGDSPMTSEPGDEDGSLSPGDSPTRTDKRVLVTGATLTCGVRDVWSYCGHGDARRRRRKGQTQEESFSAGSPLAKTIIHMMADFALRLNGNPDKNGKARAMCPYYPKYVEWKEASKAAHPDWNPGHCHNHAIRKVAKAILKDIWRVQHGEKPVYGEQTPWTPRNAGQPAQDLQPAMP